VAPGIKVAVMLDLLLLLANGEPAKPAPQGGPPLELPLLLGGIILLFFLVVLRPAQRRQERERQQLLNALKKNDKVLTTAGIYGTVVSVSDKEDEVIVKVDDNTRLKMLKSSIHRNISAEEAKQAEADKAKEAK
jgi:preprotein translocase subunit YajC